MKLILSYFWDYVYENHNVGVVTSFKIVREANILVFILLIMKFVIRKKKQQVYW